MKRLFILSFLLLCATGARADAVSDAYSDGAGYGKSNAGQGTSATKGTDPASVIPGYTASPSQSGYYGGVQGGDGGISDKGQTELGQSEAGQGITDSSTKNPAVTIDPNADFIQNGKTAEANAGTVMDGTSSQCTTKVVSKSVFENYSCDRDVNQVQTCARTGSIQVTGSKETYATQLVMNAGSSSAVLLDNYWIRYDFTVPDDGTLTSGTFSFTLPSQPGYKGDSRLNYSISALGTSITTNVNKSGSFDIAAQHVTKGQVVSLLIRYNTDGHYDSGRDGVIKALANGGYVITVTLPMTAERDTTSSQVVWSESCAFDKSTATAGAGTSCIDPGGNRSVSQNGQTYTQYSDCWQYSDAYIVPVTSTGNCAQLMANRNCTVAARACTASEGSSCLHEQDTYQCQTTYTSSGLLCAGNYFCQTGDCSDTTGAGDGGFDTAVAKLAGLASAGDDVKNGDQITVKAFTGQAMSCRKAMAGFSNCCVDTGWGNSSGLANCNSEEMAIGKAKAKKVTVLVGEACARAVLGVCVQKKQAYCVFGGKLARIIQEQGRRDQLHVSFGSGDSPNCRGITVPELQAINFDLINFQDFYTDLMTNQKIPDSAAMVKQAKDRIAAQVNAQTGGK
ncbi:type-F conjugative transfer system mating-pair stabilization protein TraN [Erwinia billingiae]|uniref:type-F conjugative transfer system mating-pair stabilization protein TraN n=1 Tax=Erwinia billingiae TaxID=182337 RepID=UPI0022484ACE|nr:type-F conjugative transfer system mating-pair stabilization protein TraN [Erwinia billingiae]MCX0497971.1 type-F conjugative transfer system mating-pair stabilization protein TraN [Erwinia billingiae]